MLYVSPSIIPNSGSVSGSGQLVVGNSVRVAIGGFNQDPIVPLIAAPYSVRIVGYQYDTQFDIDLTNAPTGSTVNVVNYIV